VSAVVRARSDPSRALADEMPRLRRLVAADRRAVARPLDPRVCRSLQIGTTERCSQFDTTEHINIISSSGGGGGVG